MLENLMKKSHRFFADISRISIKIAFLRLQKFVSGILSSFLSENNVILLHFYYFLQY